MEDPVSTGHPIRERIGDEQLVDDDAAHIGSQAVSLGDLNQRLMQLEEQVLSMRPQYGSGKLEIRDLPIEDTTAPTPRLVWTTDSILTCQTSKGRNLQLRGFELHVWQDARITFGGRMFNVSRHSDWDISFRVEAWFSSGHRTRPEAEAHLGSVHLNHGHSTSYVFREYSDSLARLYSSYRLGELFLRFHISGSRTN